MKVMIKFELEILNEMNYATLTKLADNVYYAKKTSKIVKRGYVESGAISKAADLEASIIRLEENYDLIKLVMTSREGDVMESFKFGVEPICLN